MERPAEDVSYTPDQIRTYLKSIDLSSEAAQFPEPSIPWLEKLIRHNISSIPFDNLYAHYSNSNSASLDPNNIYEQVVGTGKGGGCITLNRLFGLILQGLGFDVSMHGARVHAAAGGSTGDWYFGWTHMINFVRLNGKSYLVDVAFGGLGPSKPLLLESNLISAGVGKQELRLSQDLVKTQRESERLWIFEQRKSQDHAFTPVYAFTSISFLPQDFVIIRWYTSTNKASWFTQKVICMKYLRKDEELVGMIIMDGDNLHKKVEGNVEPLETVKTEDERIRALKKYFGISLTEEEVNGILEKPSRLCS